MSSIAIRVEFDDGDLRELFPDIKLDQFLDSIPGVMRGIKADVDKSIDRHLKDTPPEWHTRQQRFIWSNDPAKQRKARAFWFAYLKENNLLDKKGGFYKRTGKLVQSWTAQTSSSIRSSDATITVEITNTSPGASYVYGAQETGWERVPSHKVTGWLSGDGDLMQGVIDDAYTVIIEQIDIVTERFDPW